MSISLVALIIVIIGIAIHQFLPIKISIWAIMSIGALIVLLTRQITPIEAFKAIKFDVIGYLLGVFVVGKGLEDSGYLEMLSDKILSRFKKSSSILLVFIFVFGVLSAILMNDTIAIIGVPVVIVLSKLNKDIAKPFLLALAFSISIGGILSPIGSPQNLLISAEIVLKNPFLDFLYYLSVPTILNLFVCYFWIYLCYRKKWQKNTLILSKRMKEFKNLERKNIKKISRSQKSLKRLAKISISTFLVLIIVHIILKNIVTIFTIPLSFIALFSALPILIAASGHIKILKELDWGTLIFFIALFILIQSVWNTNIFANLINRLGNLVTNNFVILVISALGSQIISNIPLVALYLPILDQANANIVTFMALAAGSSIAGNFFVIGAASNIIIFQSIMKREKKGFGFFEFACVGIPLGIINLFIYWLFFNFFS